MREHHRDFQKLFTEFASYSKKIYPTVLKVQKNWVFFKYFKISPTQSFFKNYLRITSMFQTSLKIFHHFSVLLYENFSASPKFSWIKTKTSLVFSTKFFENFPLSKKSLSKLNQNFSVVITFPYISFKISAIILSECSKNSLGSSLKTLSHLFRNLIHLLIFIKFVKTDSYFTEISSIPNKFLQYFFSYDELSIQFSIPNFLF